MEPVIWDDRPRLNRPVMVAAFEGWNDAADAASGAITWLRRRLKATHIARIDPEEFYDFQATRPEVTLVEGTTRKISWPANDCFAAHMEEVGATSCCSPGVEPNLRWRTFCSTVIGVARDTGCEMVVTLGALLADVPHTRPTRLTGTAVDPELIARLGLSHSRYEGPTGIVGVLHDACREAGMPSVSLWAPVPHYVASPPNPKATRALLERLGDVLTMPIGLGTWPRRRWPGRPGSTSSSGPTPTSPPTCASSKSATTTRSTSRTCRAATRWPRSWSASCGTSGPGLTLLDGLEQAALHDDSGSDRTGVFWRRSSSIDWTRAGLEVGEFLGVAATVLIAEGGADDPSEREDARQKQEQQPQVHARASLIDRREHKPHVKHPRPAQRRPRASSVPLTRNRRFAEARRDAYL